MAHHTAPGQERKLFTSITAVETLCRQRDSSAEPMSRQTMVHGRHSLTPGRACAVVVIPDRHRTECRGRPRRSPTTRPFGRTRASYAASPTAASALNPTPSSAGTTSEPAGRMTWISWSPTLNAMSSSAPTACRWAASESSLRSW